ncbi:hypothetical protein B0H10DRAFT_1951847 [Mycena sp. CBHHK59/15]|nr:hypothetical protein B0H10DRAFT_1951847 [Mycena sp. CBHHK59/15]
MSEINPNVLQESAVRNNFLEGISYRIFRFSASSSREKMLHLRTVWARVQLPPRFRRIAPDPPLAPTPRNEPDVKPTNTKANCDVKPTPNKPKPISKATIPLRI